MSEQLYPHHEWNVQRALRQMHGMEHATRLLLADFDRELVDRELKFRRAKSSI